MFYDGANARFQSQKNILIFTTNASSSLLIDSDQIVLEGSATRAVGTHMQTMKAVASQTGQYQRFLDSSSVLKYAVDADGDVYPRGVTTAWPSAKASGVLTNNGSGTLTWTAPGGAPGGSSGNVQWNNGGAFAGMDGTTVTTLGYLTAAPTASTSGSPTILTYTAPAHTGLTADTEATDINFNLARTVQFTAAGGSFTTQRAVRFQAPTYAFTSADTITTTCTVCISGAPVAGTNATLTNRYSLWVQSGMSNFDDPVNIGSGSSLASDDYLLFPFIGGSNSSGPAIRWASSASYASQSSLYLSNGLVWQGANSTHDPFKIRTGTGTSSDGTLVFEFRPTAGIFNFTPSSSVTTSRHELEVIDVTSTGTPGAGFGGQINYRGESSTTASQPMASLGWLWTDATHGTRTAALAFQTVNNADSQTERMRINFWGIQLSEVTFANLGTPANMTVTGCSDCQVTSGANNTCASGGTGSLAVRLNSVWRCFAAQN